MGAVEFIWERPWGQPSGWDSGVVLRLCVPSRHCFYLDYTFILGWWKDNGGLLALDTATKASAAQVAQSLPGFPRPISLQMQSAWLCSHPLWPAHSHTGEKVNVSKEEILPRRGNCK